MHPDDSPVLFDCTLRDGSYAVDFQFTAEDTYRLVGALDRAGVPFIEVGHGLGLNAQNSGEGNAAATDREYIDAAEEASEDAAVGVFAIPGIADTGDIEMAAAAGADFIRIGQDVTEWENARPAIEAATDHGLLVCGNLMKSYAVSPAEFATRCRDLHEWGASIVYLVDSAGGMVPTEISEYVSAVSEKVPEATIGIHAHDNLDLAMANSLAAIEAGATWIDATLGGLGRSAGNTTLEVLATVLEKQGYELDVNQKALMDVSEAEIGPLSSENQSALAVTSGYARFHSSFAQFVLRYAEEYNLDPRDLIVAVSEKNVVEIDESLVERAAQELVERDGTSVLGKETEYLADSHLFNFPGTDDGDHSPASLAATVHQKAKKSGKRSVVSITNSFDRLAAPKPTVVHVSEQVVLGNVEVSTAEQVRSVLDAVEGTVDIVALDVHLPEAQGFLETVPSAVPFDDELAIARSLASFIGQNVESTAVDVGIVGVHSLSTLLARLLMARDASVQFVGSSVDSPDERIPGEWTSVEAAGEFDVLIGFTRETGGVNGETVGTVADQGLLIDAGIGSFTESALKSAEAKDATVVRSDTRAGFISEVECELITQEMLEEAVGRREIGGVPIVAGGVLGRQGEIVVDSVNDPETVIGVADGKGGLVHDPTPEQREQLRRLRVRIQQSD